MAKTRTFYMHTLEGRPAFFDEKTQMILFAGGSTVAVLRKSLYEIRRDQRKNLTTCLRKGPTRWTNRDLYGYAKVQLPAPTDGGGANG